MNEIENLENRVKTLEDLVQRIHQAFIAAPTPQPQLQVKLPAQIANENTTAKDGLVCACGKPKKAGYNQCYDCWEKRANK
jgi:predicted carbohydrate-binding protein with CBM5 and CBM33 domain